MSWLGSSPLLQTAGVAIAGFASQRIGMGGFAVYALAQLPCRTKYGQSDCGAPALWYSCGTWTINKLEIWSVKGGVSSYRRPSDRVSLGVTFQVSSMKAASVLRWNAAWATVIATVAWLISPSRNSAKASPVPCTGFPFTTCAVALAEKA